jgi:hypothetical protein
MDIGMEAEAAIKTLNIGKNVLDQSEDVEDENAGVDGPNPGDDDNGDGEDDQALEQIADEIGEAARDAAVQAVNVLILI